MPNEIAFEPMPREIRYRVIRIGIFDNPKLVMLFTSPYRGKAEEFCWSYTGPGDVKIEQVWIKKGTEES